MKRIIVAMALMGAVLVAATGVAWAATVDCKVGVFCEGTDQPDELIGTNSVDHVYGKGGGDFLAGKKQDDVLYGGDGNDFIYGGAVGWGMSPAGQDMLIGGGGSDCMFGGSEDDILIGGTGRDDMGHYCYEFIMDTGNDLFHGGSDNDSIMAVEAPFAYPNLQERDLVFCGAGRDTVYYMEGVDRIFDCERKNPR